MVSNLLIFAEDVIAIASKKASAISCTLQIVSTMDSMRPLTLQAVSNVAMASTRTKRECRAESPKSTRVASAMAGDGYWHQLINRIIYLLFVLSLLPSLSMAQYILFYIVVMPGNHATEQLCFDYTCSTGSSLCDANGVCSTPRCESDTRRCSPVAALDIFRHAQWEGFHCFVIPKPLVMKRALILRRGYLVEVSFSTCQNLKPMRMQECLAF